MFEFTTIRIFLGKLVHRFFPETPATLAPVFSISGNAGTTGVGTASINLSGDATGSDSTAPDGSYIFHGLNPGLYKIVPVLAGHFFTPTFKDVVISDADVGGVDFVDPPQLSRFGLGLSLSNFNPDLWK